MFEFQMKSQDWKGIGVNYPSIEEDNITQEKHKVKKLDLIGTPNRTKLKGQRKTYFKKVKTELDNSGVDK